MRFRGAFSCYDQEENEALLKKQKVNGLQSAEFERIDAHHHLWTYSREEYPWMLDGMESIRRDFLIEELNAVRKKAHIDGVITVQADKALQKPIGCCGLPLVLNL